MAEGRPQLYKVRRTHRSGGYTWLANNGLATTWVKEPIDAFAFTSYVEATKVCDRHKMQSRRPDVIYHSVVPA